MVGKSSVISSKRDMNVFIRKEVGENSLGVNVYNMQKKIFSMSQGEYSYLPGKEEIQNQIKSAKVDTKISDIELIKNFKCL